jgi:hypothetical protein
MYDYKFEFAYSGDESKPLLSVFINSLKLVEVKFNLITNNFKICFSAGDKSKNDELVYFIIDEISQQKSSSDKKALQEFLRLDPDFKKSLLEFLYSETVKFYNQKVLDSLQGPEPGSEKFNQSLRHFWLDVANSCYSQTKPNENPKTLSKSVSISNAHTTISTDMGLLAKVYNELITSEYSFNLFKQEYLFAIEYNLKYNQLSMSNETNRDLWLSRIESLKNKQQRLYSKLLFRLYDELNAKKADSSGKKTLSKSRSSTSLSIENMDTLDEDFFSLNTDLDTKGSASSTDKNLLSEYDFGNDVIADKSYTKIEESYTIQLGAQLKTTHNLRLIRCDILDYCKNRFKFNVDSEAESGSTGETLTDFIEPDSILTSMCLYSENKLNALVLLVDSCLSLNSYSTKQTDAKQTDEFDQIQSSNDKITRRFAQICNRNGYDFHFNSIEQQLESIIACVSKSEPNDHEQPKDPNRANINIGDFYTTKHSNLSKAHVVFHLAAYDSSASVSNSLNQSLKKSDLSSRHAVILGLRNILKSCFMNNVHTLTLPLLLTHQMTEVLIFFITVKRKS